ncbi:MAG: helix-turn-helix transcriptional regulator [Gammaproteobacteria bacterium]|nr:helix-turn-helix transcriptional regulator [Gammaproteobacteria bacterium]
MPKADLKLMAITRACLESLHTNTPMNQNLTDKIRNLIRIKLSEGYPSLESIAESLYMSTSAIQRNLAWEGLSYTELVEEVRKSLAEMYFKQRNLSLSEIAYLLGYSELSAFSRAFRRWTGLSPRDFRGRSLDS